MNIIELRNELNELIEQGKGEYNVIQDFEGVCECKYIDEGFVYIENHLFGTERSFILDEELTEGEVSEEYRNELIEKSKKSAYRAIYIY